MPKNSQPKPTPDIQQMFQLAERYSEASGLLDVQSKRNEWGCSAPKLLVDSFAVELYLKCLFVEDMNTVPPKGHDFAELFDALPQYSKTLIREEFDQIVRDDPVLPHLAFINPDAVRVTDFERSLAAAKSTFDKRRYLYEPLQKGEWFYADLLRKAIRNVTKRDLRLAGLSKD